MTFGNVEFHLPIGLPLCEAIQVILQYLAINGGFYIPVEGAFKLACGWNKIISNDQIQVFSKKYQSKIYLGTFG